MLDCRPYANRAEVGDASLEVNPLGPRSICFFQIVFEETPSRDSQCSLCAVIDNNIWQTLLQVKVTAAHLLSCAGYNCWLPSTEPLSSLRAAKLHFVSRYHFVKQSCWLTDVQINLHVSVLLADWRSELCAVLHASRLFNCVLPLPPVVQTTADQFLNPLFPFAPLHCSQTSLCTYGFILSVSLYCDCSLWGIAANDGFKNKVTNMTSCQRQ